MKTSTLFLIIVVGFLSSSIYAQKTIWLDKNLNETTENKAVYYRVGKALEGAVSYFYKNRVIYRKVFYVGGKKEGKFHEFYNTGELKVIGKFENGLKEGVWKTYYKSGKIQKKGKYSKGKKVGIWKIFYKND